MLQVKKMTKMLKFTKAPELKKKTQKYDYDSSESNISLWRRPKSSYFPKVVSSYGSLAYFARNENIGKICKQTIT